MADLDHLAAAAAVLSMTNESIAEEDAVLDDVSDTSGSAAAQRAAEAQSSDDKENEGDLPVSCRLEAVNRNPSNTLQMLCSARLRVSLT